jgi:hypothetical protein
MFENGVLRKIFVLTRNEVIGGWRKLHNEELRNFYCSPIIIIIRAVKEDEMGGACSTNGEKRNACKILVGEPEVKRPLG